MNFSLWILFVLLDYFLLEITTPLIVHIVMEARASSDLSFIGMWNISFIIMWPLHNQSYCNMSMKNGSNVIIVIWKPYDWDSFYNFSYFFYDFLIQPAWLPLLYIVNIIIIYLSWRTSSLFFLLFENCWIRLQNLLVICDISSLLLICTCGNWNLQCEIMVRHRPY